MDESLEQLETQLRQAYPICDDQLDIEGWPLSFWRIDRPDDQLDALIEEAQLDDSDALQWEPYWAQSWRSAVDCARAARRLPLSGWRVMDLGCGLGMAGAAAAAAGARVHLVDNAPPALLFAKRNTWPWRERITLAQADWRHDRFDVAFDLILGADILYDRGQWESLEFFWRRHLADGSGRLILGEPGRRHCVDFPVWLTDRGWDVRADPVDSGRLIHARPG